MWSNQTDLTTDSKQNVSLHQRLGTFLTQFQANWITLKRKITPFVNYFSWILLSAPLGMFSLLSGDFRQLPVFNASLGSQQPRSVQSWHSSRQSWGWLMAGWSEWFWIQWLAPVFLCGPQRSGRPCQQRRAATSTCGYTPVITWCPVFIHTGEHLGAAAFQSQRLFACTALFGCLCLLAGSRQRAHSYFNCSGAVHFWTPSYFLFPVFAGFIVIQSNLNSWKLQEGTIRL